MKIVIKKEEVKEVRAIVDTLLKSAGINALEMAVKMLESVQIEEPQEGKEEKNIKII